MTFGNASDPATTTATAAMGHQNTAPTVGSAAVVQSLESWALNPRVIEVLTRAKAAIEAGAVSEGQMEHQLVAQLKVDQSNLHVRMVLALLPSLNNLSHFLS